MVHKKTTLSLLLLLACCSMALLSGCRQVPAKLAAPTVSLPSSPSRLASQATSVALPPPADPAWGGSSIQLVQHQKNETEQEAVLSNPESIAAPVSQEVPLVVAQSVDDFVGIALSSHLRIRAARARVSAASHRSPQVSSLDDPLLTNSFYPISDNALQTAAGRAGNTLSLSQKYPWPEKRWTKAAIADRETQMAAAKLAQVELEVEETVRLAYYELWFADQAIDITEKIDRLAWNSLNLPKRATRRAVASKMCCVPNSTRFT